VEERIVKKKSCARLATVILLGFLVGSYNGRLAVWKDDDPEPFRVFPCPVYLLPKKDRDALSAGIRVETMDDVKNFLENFLS
jgi:hypothetical protein